MSTDFPEEVLRTAQGNLRASLDSARMAEFVFAQRSGEAIRFVTALTDLTIEYETATTPRRRTRNAAAMASLRASVAAFSADLVHHYCNEASEGFMYRSVDKDAMGPTLVTVRSFEQLCDYWPSMGLLDVTSFFRAMDAWEEGDKPTAYFGRTRRYRATPKMLDLASQFGIEPSNVKAHFEKQMGRLSAVLVRGERPSKMGLKARPVTIRQKGPRFEAEIRRVEGINSFLGVGGFDLTDPPWVYRLFNRGNVRGFDFDQGGRLYCRSEDNWQQKSPEERSEITWQGEPTVELDVRASHAFVLYALHPEVVQPNGDHYSLIDIERDVAKGLFTAILGQGDFPKRWPKELAKKYLARTGEKLNSKYKLGSVVASLRSKHPVLDNVREGAIDWGRLQYEESECFVEALLELGRSHGIAALPVHDSIIVAERHAEIAKRVLLEAYQSRFGRTPEVTGSKASMF